MLAIEDSIDIAVEEGLATQCITIGIEVLRDGAGAHRLAVQTEGGQLVDEADNRRFLLDNDELLSALAPVSDDHP
ncbi:MAG: hypothetical protein C0476_05705 [Sphingomonas sp.]|nr:hypothetical protein [Sphingomonas sp.]MBA4224880.1 hypothetical protein [Methylobacterium sp.]